MRPTAINLEANAPRLARIMQLDSRYAPRRFSSTIAGWPRTRVADDHARVVERCSSEIQTPRAPR